MIRGAPQLCPNGRNEHKKHSSMQHRRYMILHGFHFESPFSWLKSHVSGGQHDILLGLATPAIFGSPAAIPWSQRSPPPPVAGAPGLGSADLGRQQRTAAAELRGADDAGGDEVR